MDQFQLSFAGKQINGGGILEGRNKKRVSFFQRESEKHVCTIYIHMSGNMSKWDQSLIYYNSQNYEKKKITLKNNKRLRVGPE